MTSIALFVTNLLASFGVKGAIAAMPYVARIVPVLTLVVAAVVGYEHADLVSRVCLILVALNEMLVIAEIDGVVEKIFPNL